MMSVTVRQEGTNVLLIADGKLVSVMPWQKADELAKALVIQARKAEEIAKAEQIINDNALLLRAGFPIGLSNHPKIIDETKKEAAHNRVLRSAIPNIRSSEMIYCPTVRKL